MPKRLGTADLDDLAAGATAQMSGEVSEQCECSAGVTSLPASKLYEVTKAVFSFAGDAGEGAVAEIIVSSLSRARTACVKPRDRSHRKSREAGLEGWFSDHGALQDHGASKFYCCTFPISILLCVKVDCCVMISQMDVCMRAQSRLALCDPMDCSPPRLLCPWGSPGKNTTVGYHSFLQGIFPTEGLNVHLLHWQVYSLPLNHQGSLSNG